MKYLWLLLGLESTFNRYEKGEIAKQRDNFPKSITFKITDIELCLPVATLPTENDNKLLQQLKAEFKRTIKLNKYRSEMTKHTKNNNSNYLIDPTFTKFNRLFVLSFKNKDDRTSFSEHYTPKVQIKDFDVLIDWESFLTLP